MVVSAVLPSNTGWGFQSVSSSPGSRHAVVNASTPFDSSPRPLKRSISSSPERIEEDSDDDDERPSYNHQSSRPNSSGSITRAGPPPTSAHDIDSLNHSFQSQQFLSRSSPKRLLGSGPNNSPYSPHSPNTHHRVHKRLRTTPFQGRQLPVSRIVENLDKKGLQNLIESLCQSHPGLSERVYAIAPRVTVTLAIENLRNHLNAVYNNLPYRGDQHGDYAYLRVRPCIDEFLSALADYTGHFLPPNESQSSNTLTFLDSATSILHDLPAWTNPINNHSRNLAYEELCDAWVMAINEASKRVSGLGLAHGGWEQRLERHNSACDGRLQRALSCIRQELAWLGSNSPGFPLVHINRNQQVNAQTS